MSADNGSPAKAPKSMSSRLLTMKFMQRAAASSPVSSPSTPDQPSPKRRKTNESPSSPFDVNALADNHAIQKALAEEETKRQAALERQAAEAGDTHWVLSFQKDDSNSPTSAKSVLRVIQSGYAAIDYGLAVEVTTPNDDDFSEDRGAVVGRRSFGKFNRATEKAQNLTHSGSEESESDSDSSSQDESDGSDSEDLSGTKALIKETHQEASRILKEKRIAKKRADKAEALRLAEKRKKKDIKLNRLTSISGAQKSDDRACFKCGEIGHEKVDCPKRDRSRGIEDNDRRQSKKARKSR